MRILEALVALVKIGSSLKRLKKHDEIKFHPYFHSDVRDLKGATPIKRSSKLSDIEQEIIETEQRLAKTTNPRIQSIESCNLLILNNALARSKVNIAAARFKKPLTTQPA